MTLKDLKDLIKRQPTEQFVILAELVKRIEKLEKPEKK